MNTPSVPPQNTFHRDGWFISGNGNSWGAELYGVRMSANSKTLIVQMVDRRVADDKANNWHHLTNYRSIASGLGPKLT